MLKILISLYIIQVVLCIHTQPNRTIYDQQTIGVLQREADVWFEAFKMEIYEKQPLNLHKIYRLFTVGIVHNYYQKQSDALSMEDIFIDAFKLLKNDSFIFNKMSAKSNKIPNPFQRIYWWGTDILKEEFHALAINANWNLDKLTKNKARNPILGNQQTLRSLKYSFGAMYGALKIPFVYGWTRDYIRNLTLTETDLADIEIAITTFRLSLDILHFAKQYHPEMANEYLLDTIQDMALLTSKSLRQSY